MDPIEQARQLLKKQADELRSELSDIEKRRNDVTFRLAQAERGLRGLDSKAAATVAGVHPNQFRGKRLADAIEEILEPLKHEVSIDDLLEMLKQGNANLGNTPTREWTNVKIAVSTNPDQLTLNGEMVGLVAWKKKS